MQTKRPEALRFRVFLARREGFEPPAFWSVGCLREKTEPFRLRFMLFTAVCWTDIPLFPSRTPRSNSNLGQKWVKTLSHVVSLQQDRAFTLRLTLRLRHSISHTYAAAQNLICYKQRKTPRASYATRGPGGSVLFCRLGLFFLAYACRSLRLRTKAAARAATGRATTHSITPLSPVAGVPPLLVPLPLLSPPEVPPVWMVTSLMS